MEEKTIAVVNDTDPMDIIEGLNNAANEIYHSFAVDTTDAKVKLFNAMSGDGETIKENINKTLEVVDVVIVPVEVLNDDGTKAVVPRSTLILKNGHFCSATSWGVYNSLKRLIAIFGCLHFETPIKLVPVEVKTKNGFTINIRLV